MNKYAIAPIEKASTIKSVGWIATPSTWTLKRVEENGEIKEYCGVEFLELNNTQTQELNEGQFIIFENANDVREFLEEHGTIEINGNITMKEK